MAISKKFTFKTAAIIAGIILFCLLIGFSIGLVKTKAGKKNQLKIAFVSVPDTFKQEIKDKLKKDVSGKVKFYDLEFNEIEKITPKKLSKTYDYIFTWEGQVTKEIEPFAKEFNSDFYSEMPSSMNRAKQKVLPVLLNHYGFNYYEKAKALKKNKYPESFADFEALAYEMKKQFFSPVFCVGGEDSNLLAFISTLVESQFGSEGYDAFVKKVKSGASFADILNYQLSNSDSQGNLGYILDKLRTWANDGLIHPTWYTALNRDFLAFAQQEQIGVVFMSLSDRRNLDYSVASSYKGDRVPVCGIDVLHGVICPSIVCVKLTKSKVTDEIIKSLVLKDEQRVLSKKTKLAPVASKAQAVDKQANDVRYLAAVCPMGQISDLSNLAFQKNVTAQSDFAQAIRAYLKNGAIK